MQCDIDILILQWCKHDERATADGYVENGDG